MLGTLCRGLSESYYNNQCCLSFMHVVEKKGFLCIQICIETLQIQHKYISFISAAPDSAPLNEFPF